MLLLLIEMCGHLLLPLDMSSSINNALLGKDLLAAANNLNSSGYLALSKTCYKDLVYIPFYREIKPPT